MEEPIDKFQTVRAAHGQTYAKMVDARRDWAAGTDFRIEGTGTYLSIRDAEKHGLTVTLRYGRGAEHGMGRLGNLSIHGKLARH